MIFFKFLNFPLKSSEIPVDLRFQLASVTINFTDNRDYRAVLFSMELDACCLDASGTGWSTPAGSPAEDAGNAIAASFEDSPRTLWSGQASVGPPARIVPRRRRQRGLHRTGKWPTDCRAVGGHEVASTARELAVDSRTRTRVHCELHRRPREHLVAHGDASHARGLGSTTARRR